MTMATATWSDWAALGRTVGTAFADDPVSRWALGTPAAIVQTFQVLAREVYLRRGGGVIAADGGAMWLGPGGEKSLPCGAQSRLALALVRESGPGSVLRALRVEASVARRRPVTPHYDLFAVGVLPGGRGCGLGSALIGQMTAAADRDGVECWLENTNSRNVSLYRRMGFEAVETFTPAPGAPPISTMRRPRAR